MYSKIIRLWKLNAFLRLSKLFKMCNSLDKGHSTWVKVTMKDRDWTETEKINYNRNGKENLSCCYWIQSGDWKNSPIVWKGMELSRRALNFIRLQAMLACNLECFTHWGRDKMDAISQTTFSSTFSWMKMFEFRLKFHWSLLLRV